MPSLHSTPWLARIENANERKNDIASLSDLSGLYEICSACS